MDRADLWSDVRPGSLYGALHRLAAEGLIEPLRTEQSGNLPARTVYAITEEGHRELRALRAEALREVGLRPDPVDLAVAMSGDLDEDTLRGYVEDRITALSAQAAQVRQERISQRRSSHHRASDHGASDHGASRYGDQAWPDQTVADDLVAEHARLRLEAELTWHQLLLDQLPKLAGESQTA